MKERVVDWFHLIYNHIRVFFGLKRKLHSKWTVETATELALMHGIDVAEELAKILQEEIEKEIKENGTQTWKEICEGVPRKASDSDRARALDRMTKHT